MAGYIPQNVLDEIRQKVDIVSVISEYLPLKKSGSNFRALCPFHSEKTPSFMVSPAKQIYHCFGCGEGGNVFNFVMKYEHLDFPDAVRKIANKVGVRIPETYYPDKRKESLFNQLYKINQEALRFYNSYLINSDEAKKARDYLRDRGFDSKTIDSFKLGYAPGKWGALFNYLKKKGYASELIEKAGLITHKKGANYYDLFRDRLIFPINNTYDKVIGFGARTLSEDKLPKYINTPETPIFSKRKNLYGLNLAKRDIVSKDVVIIVEGFTDCIRAHLNDIKETVASLGTALTIEQIRILKRYTKNVVLVYDADQAGELASLRGLDLLVAEDIIPKIVSLPQNYDPDRYIQEFGPDEFRDLIKRASNLFDYKINLLSSKYDVKKPEAKAKITAEFLPTLRKINNAVLKSAYAKELAERLEINEESILSELSKYKEIDYSDYEEKGDISKEINMDIAEKLLLTLMVENNHLIDQVRENLEPDDFSSFYTRKIVSEIYEMRQNNQEVNSSRLIDRFSDENIIRAISLISLDVPEIKDINKNLVDCIRTIKRRNIEKRLKHLQLELKVAQDKKIESRMREITSQFNDLVKKQKELITKI